MPEHKQAKHKTGVAPPRGPPCPIAAKRQRHIAPEQVTRGPTTMQAQLKLPTQLAPLIATNTRPTVGPSHPRPATL